MLTICSLQGAASRFYGLVTYYREGVLQNGRGGGHVKFYPYVKGGGSGKRFSHAEGGHKNCWGSLYAVA